MILGVGIDLVDIQRMQNAVARYGDRFLRRVFTSGELAVYSPGGSTERLAARFAAKEAVMKVLGTGWAQGVTWRDIEIVSTGGRPHIRLHGTACAIAKRQGIAALHLSLTHAMEVAAAVVVADSELHPEVTAFCAL
ncbi:MAG TPA: holo-ACP synthase [Firmicutes bacterium]|jgi:holo-[acyl-carrier protein] synthase|nr:holo-ACP synthase [Bacillota bacterium]